MVLSEFAADSTHRVGVALESQVCILWGSMVRRVMIPWEV